MVPTGGLLTEKIGIKATGPAAADPSERIEIVDPAVLRHAVSGAGLKGDVVTIAIIDLPTVGRAVVRSMNIVVPAVLRHAVSGAGLKGDVVTIAIIDLPTEDRADVRSTNIVVPVDLRRVVRGADWDDRREGITVVALQLTSRLVRRSRIAPELAGMAVVPR